MRHFKTPINRRVYRNENQNVNTPKNQKEWGEEITVSDNHIYFYQDVTPKSVMDLGIAIKTIGQQI